MTDQTPNHELNRHGQGDPNWAYEADMDTLDARVPIRDTAANRSTYEPQTDAWLLADDGQIFVGDGSAWNAAPFRDFNDLGSEIDTLESDLSSTDSSAAKTAADETITGAWTFDQQITGTIDTASDANALGGNAPSYYAALSEAETVTGAWSFDQQITGTIDNADALGGQSPSAYAEVGAAESITGTWSYPSGFEIDGAEGSVYEIRPSQNEGSGVGIRATTNPTSGNPIFAVESSGGTTRFRVNHGANAEIPTNGLSTGGPIDENGDRVATRTWTNNNADVPNADFADDAGNADQFDGADPANASGSDYLSTINGSTTWKNESTITAGDADMWSGYERYISSSAPSTNNPYIRFEPK